MDLSRWVGPTEVFCGKSRPGKLELMPIFKGTLDGKRSQTIFHPDHTRENLGIGWILCHKA